MDIGLRIKEIREQNGLSISELAEGAGISKSFLREVESGAKNITVNKLMDICNYLGISLIDFFNKESSIELTLGQRQIIQRIKSLHQEEVDIILKLVNYFLAYRR